MATGFTKGKLERNVDGLLKGFVENGSVAGVCAAVIRGGEVVYKNCFGFRDAEKGLPADQKTIFRIYSCSKVFTSVALMTLYERGLFKLYDEVGDYIPSFKNKMVAETDQQGRTRLVPARRGVRIRDLFTMTSGIQYGSEGGPAQLEMLRLNLRAAGDAKAGNPWNTERMIDEVGKLPLAFHPGDHWMYGFSIDVLGRLVEIFSGKTLAEYIKETILVPLGMEDTAFYVPEAKRDRFAVMYVEDENGKLNPDHSDFYDDHYFTPPAFESGGGGMVSTLDDLAKFTAMLANNGSFEGRRIIGRKTVELMRRNHLNEQQLADDSWEQQRGYGYGLGVRVMIDIAEADINGSEGEWGWDGFPGNWLCMDPSEDLAMVYLVNRVKGMHYKFIPKFMAAVYGALE